MNANPTRQIPVGNERLWPFYSDAASTELVNCLQAGDLGSVDGHPAVAAFEESFRATLTEVSHVAFFNSGTSAYTAGLFALALPRGAEVIVPRRTFRATVTPLLQFGLVPRFVNCSPHDGCISVTEVEQAVCDRTRAIVVTHQWGQPTEIDKLRDVADRYGLRLIEDCSHAHGGRFRDRSLGSFGDFSFFSCGTTKLVSGGTGGMFVTGSRDLYEGALLFGLPKRRCELEITNEAHRRIAVMGTGVNLRGNPFSAALAHDNLRSLSQTVSRKNANIAELDAIVTDHCSVLKPIPRSPDWSAGTWYKRPFHYVGRDHQKFLRRAKAMGIALAAQDAPMDSVVEDVARRFGVSLPKSADPVPQGDPILVLGTRDLCDVGWPRSNYLLWFRELAKA